MHIHVCPSVNLYPSNTHTDINIFFINPALILHILNTFHCLTQSHSDCQLVFPFHIHKHSIENVILLLRSPVTTPWNQASFSQIMMLQLALVASQTVYSWMVIMHLLCSKESWVNQKYLVCPWIINSPRSQITGWCLDRGTDPLLRNTWLYWKQRGSDWSVSRLVSMDSATNSW